MAKVMMRDFDPQLPTFWEIESAAQFIRPHVTETPTRCWPLLNQPLKAEVWLKHENLTPVGAFKIRGGLVYLEHLRCHEPQLKGVIAASTGNHGQSISLAARLLGLKAVIVVPRGNNPEKNAAIRALGAELVEHGVEFQDALEYSRELSSREGLHAVPSFHPLLVRGVATYGMELFRAVPNLDVVFVPIGLGSGFCGVAAARQALGLDVAIIGVVSEQAPAYRRSWESKTLVEQPSLTRVAEGVACRKPHEEALSFILRHAHDVVTVSDEEVLEAMRELIQATHHLPEGSGALAWAAFKKQAHHWHGARVACVLSGGNVSLEVLRACMLGAST
jgi:threonine dehydratase